MPFKANFVDLEARMDPFNGLLVSFNGLPVLFDGKSITINGFAIFFNRLTIAHNSHLNKVDAAIQPRFDIIDFLIQTGKSPDGHPKSPIHGHFKFPHLMAA